MEMHTLFAFAAAFFVFAASPGPDNMTIVARTLSSGAASGIAYGAGITAGILAYLALASIGLSYIAGEMGSLMTVLRYAGAVYLVWMGIRLWRAAPVVPSLTTGAPEKKLLPVFLTGIALNLGNPKMPLFYIALLPNFAGDSLGLASFIDLACAILAVEVVVVGGHVAAALRARRLLRTPAIVKNVNRAAGTLLAGAGLAVLASHRGS